MNASKRRHDIDWLRVLGMLTVFLFHCARFFDHDDWHVKNTQLSFGMSVFIGVVAQWLMPLFFILSAIAAYHALGHRDNGQYLGERLKRLVVPLVFGIFVLAPPQVYIERVSHARFAASFIDFLPHYLDGLYGFGGNFAWMGLHLWYLELLFVFSLLTLPLFRRLRGQARLSWVGDLAARPGGLFLPVLPLALVEMLVNLQPHGIGRRSFGGWSPFTYLVVFLLGYLLACDRRLQSRIQSRRGLIAVIGAASTIVGFLLLQAGYSSYAVPFAWLRALNAWSWLLAFLGFGSRHLAFTSPLLRYANQALLPFYVLHQPVIVVVGYTLKDWPARVLPKFLVIAGTSFVIIVALYQFLIRRSAILRFLFGLKLKRGRRTHERDLAQNLA